MSRNKQDVYSRIEEEHDKLRSELGNLSTFAMRESDPDDFAEWRLEFVWQLRDLKNRLLKHFDLEESGGFMRDVIDLSPESCNKVEQLRREHHQFTAALDKLIETLRAMPNQDQAMIQKLRMELSDLIVALRDHENEEHRLIQKAYYRVYGGQA